MTPSADHRDGEAPVLLRIAALVESALRMLGARVTPLEIDGLSVTIHEAMAGRARLFHTPVHLFDLLARQRADPIETLAILFHDVVYLQVDGVLSTRVAATVLPLCAIEQQGHRFRASFAEAVDPVSGLVLETFGISPRDTGSTANGLNELLSALVAAHHLAPLLPADVLVSVAACIEATIPFRATGGDGDGPYDRLARRIRQAHRGLVDGESIASLVRRAVRVANRDVGNFAAADVREFLDNTWKLMPETSPALRSSATYTIVEYRTALSRTEGFLSSMEPERIFHRWSGEPDAATYAELLAAAGRNLATARRYLGVKLYAAALLECLALCTGGDAPFELFPGPGPRGDSRAHGFAELLGSTPQPSPGTEPSDLDPTLMSLLVDGRNLELAFDLRTSPIAAFLYRHLGEARVMKGADDAKRLASGSLGPSHFLQAQPAPLVAAVARAAAEVAFTRREALMALAISNG